MHHFVPWQDRARCRDYDPEVFFPEKGGSSREAKRICAECPVRIECLNYALRRDERYGVWGGMSERERRRLKRMASWSSRKEVNDASSQEVDAEEGDGQEVDRTQEVDGQEVDGQEVDRAQEVDGQEVDRA
jgi:WhiB family redox-sensing transcriptional regulator